MYIILVHAFAFTMKQKRIAAEGHSIPLLGTSRSQAIVQALPLCGYSPDNTQSREMLCMELKRV